MGVSKPLSCLILFLHLIFLILINSNGVEASHQILEGLENLAMKTVDPLHRTAFHFQPPRHWINDPNGPMFYMGLYHLFYQYNPYGNVWGNIIWAHSVSTDMVNWEALEPAIYPSKPWDIKGTWSGSATVFLGQGPVIFYTGVTENMTQVQNYAVPEDPADPYLRKWIKPEDNPLIVPDQGVNGSSFRDPTTAWRSKDGHWRVVVGSRRKHRGLVYIYRSRDFRTWVKAKHPLHSKAALGMWECPDFFPVSLTSRNGLEYGYTGPNVKHVLKVSLDMKRYEYYTLGTYDTKIDRYFPDNTSVDSWDGLRFDYGNFYASKTFFDPKKDRRILWGWANESDTLTNDVAKGWAGIQLVPRTVLLDPNGKQLLFWPIEEIETLRAENVQMNNKKLQFGERVEVQGITAYQADVEVTFSIPSLEKAEPFDPSWIRGMDLCAIKGTNVTGGVGPFGLITLATDDFEEYTPVFFRVFKDQQNNKPKVLMCSDARNSSLLKDIWTEKGWDRMYKPSFGGFVDADLEDGRISLRSLIDHSVVESFAAKGKTAITSRVYPTKAVAGNSHLYVFNYGAEPITIESLSAWSMMRPRIMNSD